MDLKSLKLGDQVRIEIIEALSADEFVVSIDGTLLRTRCLFSAKPTAGEKILAIVTAIRPLQFKAANPLNAMGISLKV